MVEALAKIDSTDGDASPNFAEGFTLEAQPFATTSFCKIYKASGRRERGRATTADGRAVLTLVRPVDLVIAKKLDPPFAADEEDRAAFKLEADALRAVGTSPAARIPRFIAYTEHYGNPVIIQEYIEGVPLRIPRRANKFTCLPPYEVRRFLEQMLQTLREVHGHGYVHNDLRPSNILCRSTDGGKSVSAYVLIDFGYVQKVRASGRYAAPSQPGAMVSRVRPGYVAPERTAGGAPYHCSDIFSLGIMAIQLLTGAIIGELTWNPQGHITLPPHPFGSDPMLERLLTNMTCFHPWQRYQDAGEALKALELEKPAEVLSHPEQPDPIRALLYGLILFVISIAAMFAWHSALATMCKMSVGCSAAP